MPNTELLGTVSSIVTAAGVTMLFFRVEREVGMREKNQVTWIPFADRLLIGATFTSIFLVLVPILLFDSDILATRIPTAACSASLVALAGYMLALPAHYRLIFGSGRRGARENPEPHERLIVIATTVGAVALFGVSFIATA